MKKYKNINTIPQLLIWFFINIAFILPAIQSNKPIESIFTIFAINIIAFLIIAPGHWDIYILETKVVFKNNWLFYKTNKYELTYDEIELIEVTYARTAPYIHVFWKDKAMDKSFYSIGNKATKEFIEKMRLKGIEVVEK